MAAAKRARVEVELPQDALSVVFLWLDLHELHMLCFVSRGSKTAVDEHLQGATDLRCGPFYKEMKEGGLMFIPTLLQHRRCAPCLQTVTIPRCLRRAGNNEDEVAICQLLKHHAPTLRYLRLPEALLSVDVVTALADCPNLQQFPNHFSASSSAVANVLHRCPSLTKLELFANTTTPEQAFRILAQPALALRTLSCPLTHLPIPLPTSLSILRQLHIDCQDAAAVSLPLPELFAHALNLTALFLRGFTTNRSSWTTAPSLRLLKTDRMVPLIMPQLRSLILRTIRFSHLINICFSCRHLSTVQVEELFLDDAKQDFQSFITNNPRLKNLTFLTIRTQSTCTREILGGLLDFVLALPSLITLKLGFGKSPVLPLAIGIGEILLSLPLLQHCYIFFEGNQPRLEPFDEISSPKANPFIHLPSLLSLTLETFVDDDLISCLVCPALQWLHLGHMPGPNPRLGSFLHRCPNLVSLALERVSFPVCDPLPIFSLRRLSLFNLDDDSLSAILAATTRIIHLKALFEPCTGSKLQILATSTPRSVHKVELGSSCFDLYESSLSLLIKRLPLLTHMSITLSPSVAADHVLASLTTLAGAKTHIEASRRDPEEEEIDSEDDIADDHEGFNSIS